MQLEALIASGELGVSQWSARGERLWPLVPARPEAIRRFEEQSGRVLPRPFCDLLAIADGGRLTFGAFDLQFFGVGDVQPGLADIDAGRPRYQAHLASLEEGSDMLCFGQNAGELFLFDADDAVQVLHREQGRAVRAAGSLPAFWRARRPLWEEVG